MMIQPYSQKECFEILNQLKSQKRLSQAEYYLLQTYAQDSVIDFCTELITIYQDRVRQYLEDTTAHLNVSLNIPLKVGESLSIGYVYSVLAQTYFCTSPFALLSLFSGKLNSVLQERSNSEDLLTFMKKHRATLGVSLGIYSIEPYSWRCQIESDEDASIATLGKMHKTVFVNLVSLWQLYQEVGFTVIACIAATLKNNLIPSNFLESILAHEKLTQRITQYKVQPLEVLLSVIFQNDENFTLLKQSLFSIITYIQEDLLQEYFDVYFQPQHLSNPLHKQLTSIFYYTIRTGQFDLKNTEDRIMLMRRIYFSQESSKENFLNIYPSILNQLQFTFNAYQEICGNIAGSKLRLIDKTMKMPEKDIELLQTKANDFFEAMHSKINNFNRDQENTFTQIETQLTERNEQLTRQVNQVNIDHQQTVANFEAGILENRSQLAQQANAIAQYEIGREQKIATHTDELNRGIAQCRERIRTYCGNRFFAGITNNIAVARNGTLDISLNRIIINTSNQIKL